MQISTIPYIARTQENTQADTPRLPTKRAGGEAFAEADDAAIVQFDGPRPSEAEEVTDSYRRRRAFFSNAQLPSSAKLGTKPVNNESSNADINNDGVVDGSDLGLLLGQFGQTTSRGDVNGDGKVDSSDLNILLKTWS